MKKVNKDLESTYHKGKVDGDGANSNYFIQYFSGALYTPPLDPIEIEQYNKGLIAGRKANSNSLIQSTCEIDYSPPDPIAIEQYNKGQIDGRKTNSNSLIQSS